MIYFLSNILQFELKNRTVKGEVTVALVRFEEIGRDFIDGDIRRFLTRKFIPTKND